MSPNTLLSRAIVHTEPFPFLFCPGAFTPEDRARLNAPFETDRPWEQRDGAFYRCFLREVTAELPAPWLRALAARMREVTALPLTDEVVATAQRVEPGQAIGVHSDRPLLGYEIARLVVQLNPDWRPEDGGVLELFESPTGLPLTGIEPKDNIGFVFVLNERSYHGVTRANKARRSMVFNFWHVANTPALKTAVDRLLAQLSFAELPAQLGGVQAEAERDLAEELTYRAGVAAMALQRWGYDADTVSAGYRAAAGLAEADTAALGHEESIAILLADWVSRLYLEPFDLLKWQELSEKLADVSAPERLRTLWPLCFPPVKPK